MSGARYVDVYRDGRLLFIGMVDEATQEQISRGEHAPMLHWGNGFGYLYTHDILPRDGFRIVVCEDQTKPSTDRGYRHFTNAPLRD